MSLLRKIAFPFSLIYALTVTVRNKLFDLGIFSSKQFQTPTICVGNLSVGGTGKTPMIEYLIRLWKNEHQVAVLSRGYKRNSKGFLLASPESTVEDLGDEPYQIHTKFPKVSVAVDADRQNGISRLEKGVKPDVILLDDAFQHRKVKAHTNLLLTSYSDLYVDDWYLPTGNLRDNKSQAKRADFIVVTKCPNELSLKERHAITEKLVPRKSQSVLFSYFKYANELKSANSNLSWDALKNKNITLVTGIANPKPLVRFLKEKDLLFEHLNFADHHHFSPKEVQELNAKDIILTTEKDYVRLQGKVEKVFYVQVKHAFFDDDDEILKRGLAIFTKPNS